VTMCRDAPQRPVSLCAVVPPSQPADVRVPTPENGATSVIVNWNAPPLQHALYAPLEYYILSIAVSNNLHLAPTIVNVTAGTNRRIITGLELETWYSISVVAYNSAGRGASSLSAAVYIPSGPFTFSPTVAAALAAAQVVLYTLAAIASWRWPGSIRDARRDYSGLLVLPFATVHVGTDIYFGIQLLKTPGLATVYIAVFFATLGGATLWSGYRVYAFLRASTMHAGPIPSPPPHRISFHDWFAGRRSWMAAVACAGSLQLSALYVISCRAVGDVDGALSAPVDARLWRTLKFHATAIGFVRNVSSLVVAFAVGASAGLSLLSPAVFLKLATSGMGAVLAATTMAVDGLASAARRRERERGGADGDGLSMKLLSVEVGAACWLVGV
jgi:Fibronectin type III domain